MTPELTGASADSEPQDDAAAAAKSSAMMKSLLASLRQTRAEADVEANVMGFLGAFFQDLPFPAYIKSVLPNGSTRMARINTQFEQALGIQADLYFGRSDAEVFGAEHVTASIETDTACITTGAPVASSPTFWNAYAGEHQTWNGVKWPIYANGKIIGICGMSTLVESKK